MDLSVIAVGDVESVLSAMQKNLECPICLDMVKEPVSTKCDHTFCRFCMFKLISKKKKGVTQCPLCKTEVTKRSLKENSRFKQLIEGLLETIRAFELDTGVKFLNSQHFPKASTEATSAELPCKESSVIQSKGFRNRKKTTKENGQENCTLDANGDTQLPDTRVRRCSRRNRPQRCDPERGIYIELGSDSSEEIFNQARDTGLEKRAALQTAPQEKLEDLPSAEKGNEHCNRQPGRLGAEEAILPSARGEGDSSREGLSKKSDTGQAKPGHVDASQYQSSPLSGLAGALLAEQCDGTGAASPPGSGDVSVSKHTGETGREQTRCDGESSESGREESAGMAVAERRGEAVEVYEPESHSVPGAEPPLEKPCQAETLHSAAVGQVSRKRLRRSIQKVNEWFSKSNEILSSTSSRDGSAGASDGSGGGDGCSSDKDSCLSEKTDPMAASMEIAVVGGNKRQSEQPAESLKDKIFGKTYRRERKSSLPVTSRGVLPTANKAEVTAAGKCLSNSSKGRLKRKRKTHCVLQPEDFIQKKAVEEAGGCPEDAGRKRCDESPAAGESHPSENREDDARAELEAGEGSMWKKAVGKVTGKHCDGGLELSRSRQKSTTKRSSAARRCRRSRAMCALELVVDRNPGSPGPTGPQMDSFFSSQERRQARRSRRLQLLPEDMRKEGGKGVVIPGARGCDSDHEGPSFGVQRNVLVHASEHGDPCQPQGDLEANEKQVGLKNSPEAAETRRGLFNPTPSCQRSKRRPSAPDAGSQEGEILGSCFLLESPLGAVEQTASQPAGESPPSGTAAPQESAAPGDFGTEKLPMATNASELAKEAEDSELDTQYLRNIFRHSKRQSFSLYPAAVKASAVEGATPETLKVAGTGQAENQHNGYLETENLQEKERTAESLGGLWEEEEEELESCDPAGVPPVTPAVGSAERGRPGDHLEGVSQVANPGNVAPLRTGTSGTEGNNRSQKRKRGDEETASTDRGVESELGQNPVKSSGSQGDQSDTEEHLVKRTGLTTVNRICFSSERDRAGEARAVDSEGWTLRSQSPSLTSPAEGQQRPTGFSWELTGEKHSKRERKPIKGKEDQAAQPGSAGVPECSGTEALEEPPKAGSSDFTALSETPDGLLCSDGDMEENTSFSEAERRERSAVFVKRSDSAPGETPRDRDVGSKPRSRRRARKLQSSDEESSESEDFPCFQALLFGPSVSTPLQTNKQGPSVVEASANPVTLPQDASLDGSNVREVPGAAGGSGCVSPSQESECSVNLFSSQSNVSEESADGAQELKKPLIPVHAPKQVGEGSESKEASRGCDRGLEGSKAPVRDECREDPHVGANLVQGGASGYESETSHVEDSCGPFSQDEILTTQQKNAMQNNLKKLQQEMAALEAVLNCHGSQEFLPSHREPPRSSSEGPLGMEPVRPERENAGEQKPGTRLNTASVLSNLSGNVTRSPNNPSSSVRLLNPPTAEAAKGPVAAQDAEKSRARGCKSKRNGVFPLSVPPNAAGKENAASPAVPNRKEMSIVASGLNQSELLVVQKFARKTHSTLSNHITEGTTHVVMRTDKELVCERTLKYFLGIAGRKWVVSYQWVIQSFKEGRILDEESFEVRGDVINGRNHQGPKRARQSLTEKIFKGFEICCLGPFTDMTTEHLEWMVELCGASVVKQLHLFTHAASSTAVVVVQPDAWMENPSYRAIQEKSNVSMVTREWVLDSVACYRCQELGAYLVS
ncbi:BRCA1 protein, partial [Jacana jacana]|nr:BRCA1 protein [Jacana jacana]